LSRAGLLALVLAAGCGSTTVDVCAGITGTCLDLTIKSSQPVTVSSLRLTASGAVTGTQTSKPQSPATLPVHVGVTLPPGVSGALHLSVDGLDGSGQTIASGATAPDPVIVAGQRQGFTVDIEPLGGGDGGLDGGGSDGGADGGDGGVVVVPCDPHGVAGPQCVWRWQNPAPQGDDLVGVYAFTDNDTWAVNPSGLLIHRDANGWSYTTPPTAFPPAFFAEGLTGGGAGTTHDLYAYGLLITPTTRTQAIYHTTDESTWTAETIMSPPAGTSISGIGSSADNLWQLAVGTDYPTSTDGLVFYRSGTNWVRATTPAVRAQLRGVAASANTAVVAGDNVPMTGSAVGLIWYSMSGPFNTWSAATLVPPSPLNGACTSSGTFIVVGDAGAIAFTQNVAAPGGGFANAVTTGTSAKLRGCVAVNNSEAWAFGDGGVLVHTTDGGAHWTTKSSGVTQNLLAATQSASALTLTGGAGTILRSTDSGVTITEEDSGIRAQLAALWGTGSTVYAVGAAGAILRTTDDGQHWTSLNTTGTTNTLFTVWGSSATDVYAGGQNGTIVHATDGVHFTKVVSANIPAGVTIQKIAGTDATDVFATGVDSTFKGQLLRSTDGGATWAGQTVTGLDQTVNPPLALHAFGTHVWVQAQNTAIFHGTIAGDKSITWNQQPLRFMGSPITDEIGAIGGNATDLYATTSNSAFVHATMPLSSTGGTWDYETQAPAGIWGDGLADVELTPSGSTLYMTGSGGFLTSTTPGGAVTWSQLFTGIASVSFGAILPLADNDVFVLSNGGIIHYGN